MKSVDVEKVSSPYYEVESWSSVRGDANFLDVFVYELIIELYCKPVGCRFVL